jgi:hypothetical protein
MMDRRLLILSCSHSKRSHPRLLPAIERYDGPAFRLLRKYLAHDMAKVPVPDIYILSGKFGLIPATRLIPDYDQRMTQEQAHRLHARSLTKMTRFLKGRDYNELFMSLGKDYLLALAGYEQLIPSNLQVIVSTGSQGRKLTNLRDWLYGIPAVSTHHVRIVDVNQRGTVYLRGIQIDMTREQVLAVAHRALTEGRGSPANYHSWYVLVDDQRVAPKWLVSQLSGLPVSDFHTSEATRVLQQLGVQVYPS